MATKAAAAAATAAKSTLSAAAEAGYQYTWKEKLQKFKAELASKSATAAAAAAAKSAGAKSKASGAAEASYQYPWMEKLEKFKGELRKGVWGYWHLGAWKPLALSARQRARLRKEVLLAGEDWPYDPPKGEMRTKRKGHKVDRIAAEKRANTAELMKKMPEMLLDYKKRRWEKKMKAEEEKD